MQAEELIQQKEWLQLTEEEKSFLQPLASCEGEYNILKKMLQLAAAEKDDVPAISPDIQFAIRKQIKGSEKSKLVWLPYAAAAVILIALLGLFVYLPSKKEAELVRKTDQPLPKTVDTLQNKTPSLLVEDQNELTGISKDSNGIVNQTNHPVAGQQDLSTKRKDVVPGLNPGEKKQKPGQSAIAINTTVSGNSELLAFVTEVY
jgi:hypothetical protein